MIKRVLLTGGTGFIGSHVLETLLANGCRVGLLKRSGSDLGRLKGIRGRFNCYDVDREDLQEVFRKERPQAVVHLATYYKKAHLPSDLEPMRAANVLFPTRLLQMACENNVDLFLNTGTFFEYNNRPLPVNEDRAEPHPFNLYAKTKIEFEGALKEYSKKHKMAAVTLKIFSPYGPRDEAKKLIPSLLRRALNDEEISLSQGFQKLDFVYVKDIAQAFMSCLEKSSTFAEGHEAFNVGSGFPVSVREIVSVVEELLQRPIKKKWGKPATDDLDIIFADITKVRDRLGWIPRTDLFKGLAETLVYEKRRRT